MSRTIHGEPPNWHRKESKSARRTTLRKFRHATKKAIRTGTVEPIFKGTEGWLTH